MTTRDPDPLPPSEPWLDRPLTAEELKALRVRLANMSEREVAMYYEDALYMCRLDQGVPPRAAFIQQLVAAWKELQRRRKSEN